MAELYKSVTELMKTARGNKALQGNLGNIIDFQQIIDDTLTADVVEVVRCEKCTHKIDYKGRVMCKRNAYIIALEFGEEWCGLTATKNDHFCSYGERKDT